MLPVGAVADPCVVNDRAETRYVSPRRVGQIGEPVGVARPPQVVPLEAAEVEFLFLRALQGEQLPDPGDVVGVEGRLGQLHL